MMSVSRKIQILGKSIHEGPSVLVGEALGLVQEILVSFSFPSALVNLINFMRFRWWFLRFVQGTLDVERDRVCRGN